MTPFLTTSRLAFALIAFWIVGAISPALAQGGSPVPAPRPARLSVLSPPPAAPNTTRSAPRTAEPALHDVKTISPLDQPQIAQTFLLRNDTAHPLTLAHLQPSCTCTRAVVTVGSATAFSRMDAETLSALSAIASGQQFTVRVSVDTTHLAPGPLFKSVALFVQGDPEPAATLKIAGQLLPVATFDPAFLDFGTVDFGTDNVGTQEAHAAASVPPQRLTVSLDARLAPGGRWPALTCSNPDVRVTPLPEDAPNLPPAAGTRRRVRTYQLTLVPGAALGPLQGRLSFVPESLAPVAGATDPQALLAELSVPLLGEVRGEVSAAPAALAFGSLAAGQAVTRPLLLTSARTETLAGLQASCDSPWLTVRLAEEPRVFSGGTAPAAVRALEVTLRPGRPAGALQAEIAVMLRNGQRLLIPASAYTTPASSSPLPSSSTP